jgi:hypothetical protein
MLSLIVLALIFNLIPAMIARRCRHSENKGNNGSKWSTRSLTTSRCVIALVLAWPAFFGLQRSLVDFRDSGFTAKIVSYILGRSSLRDYWRSTLGLTADLFAAANRLPAKARILAINEARRYPFARSISLASVFDQSPLRPAVSGASDGETIRRRLIHLGYTHLLVNEFEQDRILRMHTPLGLLHDERFLSLLNHPPDPVQARQTLAAEYWGYTEFSVDPLTPSERLAYGQFLRAMRQQAIWQAGADTHPAMWIAPLEN